MTPPDDRTRTVEIPDRTASAISKRLHGTEFESVDSYVAFVLGQLLRELDRPADEESRNDPESRDATTHDAGSDDEPSDGAADEAVADRLESLGYL